MPLGDEKLTSGQTHVTRQGGAENKVRLFIYYRYSDKRRFFTASLHMRGILVRFSAVTIKICRRHTLLIS